MHEQSIDSKVVDSIEQNLEVPLISLIKVLAT